MERCENDASVGLCFSRVGISEDAHIESLNGGAGGEINLLERYAYLFGRLDTLLVTIALHCRQKTELAPILTGTTPPIPFHRFATYFLTSFENAFFPRSSRGLFSIH